MSAFIKDQIRRIIHQYENCEGVEGEDLETLIEGIKELYPLDFDPEIRKSLELAKQKEASE